MSKNINELVSKAERIGVIGSPSSTSELALDIMGTAVNKKLVGELALFRYPQDNLTNYALGQITEVSLRNIWHEDPTMRSLIRQRGRVDAVSERQDTHQGEMNVSAVFADSTNGYKPSILGTVPATGTPIHLVDDVILDTLLYQYKQQLFYLGYVYGSKPKLPLWLKHFDKGTDGAGEAYHIGIFGKTGSGKSVLSKMILVGYLKHRQMGVFVLDPQGEFALDLKNETSKLSVGKVLHPSILKGLGRPFEVYDLSNFRLGTWELLGELLVEFDFFKELGIKAGEYQSIASSYIVSFFKQNKKHHLSSLDDAALIACLDHLHKNIHRIYAGEGGIERVQGFIQEIKDKVESNQSTLGESLPVKEIWDKVIQFFLEKGGKVSSDDIVRKALKLPDKGSRPLIIVDLSKRPQGISSSVWDDKIKPLLIDVFLNSLMRQAEYAYENEKLLNTLVVLDEAHRLAPQEKIINNERKQRIKNNLVDAVRTTRKFGLGWMFLSQTLSSLDNEIVQQMRISFFGFGLSMGSEFNKLKELVAGRGEYLKLYQQFRDPQSSFDNESREYSFMTIGPVSPLSFSGTPLFLNAFTKVEDFKVANEITVQEKLL